MLNTSRFTANRIICQERERRGEERRSEERQSRRRRHLGLKGAAFVNQKAFGTSRRTFFYKHDSTDTGALLDNGTVAGFVGRTVREMNKCIRSS